MALRRSPFRVLRLGLLLVALAVMACGNNVGTQAPGSPLAGGPTPAPGASAPLQGALAPTPLAQYLLDTTTFQVRMNGKYAATIIATLPTGNTIETTYTLDPKPVSLAALPPPKAPGSPLQAFHVSPQTPSPNGDLKWAYDYVIPTDGFPSGAFAAAPDGESPGWLAHVVQALLEPRSALASGGEGVHVAVQSSAIAIGAEGLSHLEAHHVAPNPASLTTRAPFTAAGASAWAVWEAIHLYLENGRNVDRLVKLRKCAENPTNPLTRKNYESRPADKQQVLNEVTATSVDSTLNTAAQFVGALNAKAASFFSKAAPWLGLVVEPGTAWANSNLQAVSNERIDQLERLVPKCDLPRGTWTGEIKWTYGEVGDRVKEEGIATVAFSGTEGEWSGQRTRTEDHNARDCPWIRTFATKGEGAIGLSVLDLSGRNPLAAPGNPPGQAQPQTATLVIMPASHSVSLDLDLTGKQTDAGGGPACPGFKNNPVDIQRSITVSAEGPNDAGNPNVLSGTKTTTPFPGATVTITWKFTNSP